ncbi:uncharacterized protein KIAA2012 homolog [Polypterus senegalus]|uniref:uncharacterized protein KIAA2012 homolog n=1 Tax=Polypterus senegalus TaxID=55291 RepID=UPI001965600C|nr:uncharacterized protein KIAA2012 homolog [Polypterus senegalus]XP_039599083.1 uncharacterized protein KIAA2012 homolog [Polypterus senegalus]
MKELNLSLLSRGCGQEIKEKVTDIHGRIEVYYEPEDYFNWVSQRHFFRLRKIENERGPLRPPVYMAEPVPPRTFSTRKGPLILYSEELALSAWTLANADRRGRGPQAMGDKDERELNTLRDLTGAILAYGNKQAGHKDIRSFFQFLGPPEENADRQVRPGYSAKRYLACLSQTWDPTNVQKIRAGALGDAPPMPEGAPSTLPHYRGQHDLSSAPRPYKVLPSIPTALEALPEGRPIWDSTSPPETHDDPKGRNEMPTERTKKNVEYQILIPVPCSELSPIPEARPGTEAENRDPENVIIRLSPVKSIKEEEEEETPAQALRAAMACISIDASWLQSEAHSTSEEGTPQKAPVPPPVPPEQRADAQDQFLPSILPTFLLDVSPPRMPERKPLRLPRLAEPSGTKRRCEEVELPKELLILPLLQLKGIGQDGGLGLADLLDNENENEVETGEPPNQEEQSEERPPGPLAEDKTQKKLLGSLQKFGLPTSGQDSEACEGQESTDPQLPPKSFLEILPPIVSKKGPRNQSSLAFLKARLKENRDMEDGIIRGVLPFEIREYYKSGSVGSIIMGPDGRIVHLSLLGSLKDQGKDLGEESQEHNGDELRGIPGISMAPGSTVFLPQEKGFHLVDYNLEQHERSALHLFDSMCQDQNTQVRDEGGQTLTASHKGSGLPVVDTWQDSAFLQKGQRVADKSNNTASLGGQRGSGPSSNQKGGTTAALASGRDGASLPPVLKVKRRMGFDMLKQPGDADLQNMRDPRPPVAGASPIESWKHPETSGGPESPHLGSTAARHPGDPQAGHRRLGPLVDMAGQASASNSMLRNSGHTMDIHPEGNLDGGTEEDGRTQHPQVGAASHQRALGKSKKGSDLKGRARFVVGKPKEKRPEDKSQAAGTTAKTAKHQRGHKRRRKVGPAEDGQGQDEEVSSAGQKAHSGKKPPRKGGLDMEEEEEKKKKEEEEDEEEEKEKGSTKQAAGRGQQGTKKEVADETAHMSFSRTSEQLRKQDTDKEDEEEEEEEEEEADFIIYKRELDSSDNKNLKARQAQAALDRNRPASLVTSGPASHLGTPSTPAVPTELLAVRDAERADNAEKRRQEVERKRREREELRKRMEQEKQEQHEREDRMKQELEEDERRRAEEMQLKKLQQEAEQQQQEEQERMRQRLQAAAQERERRAQEEHRRKLLLLQKLRRQEEEQRAAEAARRQAEEDARRAEEARRMQEMSELERHEYQRWKREEEERRRREEEERQSVAAERMQRVLEEAKWQALLLARQRAVLEQQLIFQRDLLAEADGMERAQEISRPWVYSYFELLEMLGLPLPAEGVQKEA